jgi:Skp family chaperone for outer membrane proteins
MPCRAASLALILAFIASPGFAAQTDAVATADVERMTPAQLRALQAKLDKERASSREQNAMLSRRVQELERRHLAQGAKKAELEARLADVRERLARLKEAQDN